MFTDTEYGEAQDFADFIIASVMNGATSKVAAESAIAAFFRNGKWVGRSRIGARLPARQWQEIRDRILSRDEYTCAYCGSDADHVDHIHPISKGGSNEDDNLTAACATCNISKGDRLLSEWRRRQ